jgi:starvation-inducible DNA-binding protein
MKAITETRENHSEEIVTLLNTLLADEYVIFTKTRNARWNIQGPGFIELHNFFKSQCEILEVILDDIAEQIRALGYLSPGSIREYLKLTHLSESLNDFSNSQQILQALVTDHQVIINTIVNGITPVTDKYQMPEMTHFVNGLKNQHEDLTWILGDYYG